MSDPCYPEDVETIVSQMLSRGPHDAFIKYWELYKTSSYIAQPKGIYFRVSQDGTYRNLVIAGKKRIVDIEIDENNGDTRTLAIFPYRAFSGVVFYMGSIPTFPRTKNSLLTIVCQVAGSVSHGSHWSAHNEEEVERLRSFAKVLVESVSYA